VGEETSPEQNRFHFTTGCKRRKVFSGTVDLTSFQKCFWCYSASSGVIKPAGMETVDFGVLARQSIRTSAVNRTVFDHASMEYKEERV